CCGRPSRARVSSRARPAMTRRGRGGTWPWARGPPLSWGPGRPPPWPRPARLPPPPGGGRPPEGPGPPPGPAHPPAGPGCRGREPGGQCTSTWRDVPVPAAQQGLAARAGSSTTVGVPGYPLGGGLGWLARRYGLAANSVTAAELVTPDGDLVRADAGHEP